MINSKLTGNKRKAEDNISKKTKSIKLDESNQSDEDDDTDSDDEIMDFEDSEDDDNNEGVSGKLQFFLPFILLYLFCIVT